MRKFSAWRSSLRGERDRADLGHPFDDVGDLGTEQLLDALDGGQRVLDDVVEQAGGDGDHVQPHVGEDVGDLERMDEVGLARVADLSLVLEGGEDVGPPEQLDVGVGAVGPDLFDQVLEPNHGDWCPSMMSGSGSGPGCCSMIPLGHGDPEGARRSARMPRSSACGFGSRLTGLGNGATIPAGFASALTGGLRA